MNTYTRAGQSADLTMRPGDIMPVQAFWRDGDGKSWHAGAEVRAYRVGRYVVTLLPLIGGLLQLDAEPAYIIIDVIPGAVPA